MSILVTGGTGFLGEALVRTLVEEGQRPRVLARSSAPTLAGLDVELVSGDVTVRADMDRACQGVSSIYHLAGLVSRDPDDAQKMMRVHVDGTRVVFQAAAAAGVKRIVVASSSGTVAVSEFDIVHDESAEYATELVAGWPYYASKIYQEKLALSLGEELGIEVVIVSPSLLLGPGDHRLSSTKDVWRFMKGQIPTVTEGGVNFVDVRDAAPATVRAMESGRAGHRYLLGGPNWTVREFFGRLSRVAKVGQPRLRLPSRWAKLGASVLEHAYRASGKEPPVDRISVEMGYHYWYVDSSKARKELEFECRDPTLTLSDTVKYLRQDISKDDW